MMLSGNNKYLNADGTLNWDDACEDTLWRASHSYSYFKSGGKSGVPHSTNQQKPEAQEIIDTCNDLFLLFTTIFTSYPFWNDSQIAYVEGQTDKVSKLTNQEFDSTGNPPFFNCPQK